MDWNRLSGPQLGLLRETIMHVFPSETDFDLFLSAQLNKPSMRQRVGPMGYENTLFRYLPYAQGGGWTDKLIKKLQDEAPDNPLVRNLPDAIRAAGASAPDRLSSPKMELEKIVKGGGFADLRLWAEKLALVSEATCRIEFPAGQPQGTGILVAPDLVLTNYHVVETQLQRKLGAGDIVCRFGYARDTKGCNEGTVYKLVDGNEWAIACSPYDEADESGKDDASPSRLDYALLRLQFAITDWEPIPLAANADLPVADLPVLIVQHPAGTPQALAIGKSLGMNKSGSRFRYDTDTLAGSSGSPVLDQALKLVALHHAGDPRSSIRAEYNQGIPISMIAESLRAKEIPKFWQ